MPRTGGGTGPFVLNPVYLAVPGTTILATQHNTPLEDIEDTFNIPQPIAYGGTQAASAIEAMDNLFIVGADKASSASIDLDNVTGSFVNITGTTPVTSIALAEGAIRFARAVSALPLTASASLIVNGSTTQPYTCEAGDQMMIVGDAGSIVRVWVTGRNKFIASQFRIADGTDQTKQVQISASGLPTGTVRTLDAPYYSGTLGLVSDIRGYVNGWTFSKNTSDPTNDVDIDPGVAVDTTGARPLVLASSLTKRADASWAVGSGNGWLDTGAIGNNRYAIWGILRSDTGVVDSLLSLSFSSPTMPTNYNFNVLLGEITRTGGFNGTPIWYGSAIAPNRRLTRSLGGYAWEFIAEAFPSAAITQPFTNLSAYRELRATYYLTPSVDNETIYIQTSINNGGGYDSTNYVGQRQESFSTTLATATTSGTGLNVARGVGNTAPEAASGTVVITEFNQDKHAFSTSNAYFVDGSGVSVLGIYAGRQTVSSARNAIRFLAGSGTITGYIVLEGLRG